LVDILGEHDIGTHLECQGHKATCHNSRRVTQLEHERAQLAQILELLALRLGCVALSRSAAFCGGAIQNPE
jgi:hypothetical protein